MRKIAEHYRLPYYTISPTYSVCRNHGYLSGEVYTCPHCGEKTEVYSRITGYYRPVQNWNDGKAQEFKDRKVYDLGRSKLRRAGAAGCQVTAPQKAAEKPEGKPAGKAAGELLLFTTRTCPNCRQAEQLLKKAGMDYQKVVAEEKPDMASRYEIRQAPTLVADRDGGAVKLVGLGSVRQFINENRASS